MEIENIKRLLKGRFTCFSNLSNDLIDLIVSCSNKLSIARGCYVFKRGDSAHGLHILLSGQVKLGIVSTFENEKILSIISAGESFGETGLFLDKKLPIFAKAVVDSYVLVVPAYVIQPLLDTNKDVARNMQDKLVINIHEMIQTIEMLTLNSAQQRFINYLLQISANAAVVGYVILPTKKSTIASILNITPETLSRILANLHDSGIIKADGERITINDFVKLRQFASEN